MAAARRAAAAVAQPRKSGDDARIAGAAPHAMRREQRGAEREQQRRPRDAHVAQARDAGRRGAEENRQRRHARPIASAPASSGDDAALRSSAAG